MKLLTPHELAKRDIRRRLRHMMADADVDSFREIARGTGLSRNTIQHLSPGSSVETFRVIARFLGGTARVLMSDDSAGDASVETLSVHSGIVGEVGENIFSAEMIEPAVASRSAWTEDFVLDEVSGRDLGLVAAGAGFTVTQGLRTEGGTRERFSRISFVPGAPS